MVDSLFPVIQSGGEASLEPSRKKLKISETADESRRINEDSLKRWKTNRVQQIYTCKLVEALHRVRQRSNDAAKVSTAAREIRETADRVLAASARGTTRWSRAIIRAKLKKHRKAKSTGNHKPKKSPEVRLPAVERKLQILGRLVPGCRKVSVPNLLDEATDYIAALEMQVKTMEALAELLATTTPRRL